MRTKMVPLGEIAALMRRQVDVEAATTYTEIGVRSFGRGLFKKESVTGGQIGTKRVFRVEPGDLIVSNIFAWEGAVAVANETHRDTIGSHRFMTWHVGPNANVDYLYHYLTSERGLTALSQASPGSAGRNRTLSIKNFEALKIPLPPLNEQHRIAAFLGRMQKVAATAGLTAAQEKSTVDSLLQFDEIGESIPISELLTQVSRPVIVSADTVYDMYGVRWYGAGLFLREKRLGRELAASTVYEIHDGDLVYNRLFAWKQSFAIAGGATGTVSNEFPTFRIDTRRVRPRVLQALLLNDTFMAQVDAASSGTTPTSRNRLKEKDFLRLTVRLPTLSRQEILERAFYALDRIGTIARRNLSIQNALVPAARNEIFSAMR